MIYQKIFLKHFYKCLSDSEAFLEVFCYEKTDEYPPNYKRYPLLILPGGGYHFVSFREKDPIAFAFLAKGFNCFALTYSVDKKYPQPQLEVACAMDYIENHIEEFGLYANSKSMVGFSAGGHLSASYSCYYEEIADKFGLDKNKIKPIYQILSYSVITTSQYGHQGSINTISGGDPVLKEKMSIENNVNNNYIPTFLWATKEDATVPYENSSKFYEKLQLLGVKSKLVLFVKGIHGLSVATNETEKTTKPLEQYLIDIQSWVTDSTQFFFEEIVK